MYGFETAIDTRLVLNSWFAYVQPGALSASAGSSSGDVDRDTAALRARLEHVEQELKIT